MNKECEFGAVKKVGKLVKCETLIHECTILYLHPWGAQQNKILQKY